MTTEADTTIPLPGAYRLEKQQHGELYSLLHRTGPLTSYAIAEDIPAEDARAFAAAIAPVSADPAGAERLIEQAARRLCELDGFDPDEDIIGGQAAGFENYGPRWQAFERSERQCGSRSYIEDARAVLALASVSAAQPSAAGQDVSGPGAVPDNIRIILTGLWRYGQLRPIDGVVYGEGTHRELLRQAERLLDTAAPTPPATAPGGAAGAVSVEEVERLPQYQALFDAIGAAVNLTKPQNHIGISVAAFLAALKGYAVVPISQAEDSAVSVEEVTMQPTAAQLNGPAVIWLQPEPYDVDGRLWGEDPFESDDTDSTKYIRADLASPQAKDGVREAVHMNYIWEGILKFARAYADKRHDDANALFADLEKNIRALKSPANPEKPGQEGERVPSRIDRRIDGLVRPDWHGKPDTRGLAFWNARLGVWQGGVPEPLPSPAPQHDREPEVGNHKTGLAWDGGPNYFAEGPDDCEGWHDGKPEVGA